MADDDHTRELDISDLFAGRGPRHGATGSQAPAASAEQRVPEQRISDESMTGAQRAAAAIEDAATPAGLSSTFGGPAGSTGSLPLVRVAGSSPTGSSPAGSSPAGGTGPARGTSSEETTIRVTAVRATGKAKPVPGPAARAVDETVILPAFVTGTTRQPEPAPAPEPKPAAPAKPARPDPIAKLPSDERNMLIFVAAVLAIGTLAIVAMAGLRG